MGDVVTMEATKEIALMKRTAFTGDQKKVNAFLQECNVYLAVHKHI